MGFESIKTEFEKAYSKAGDEIDTSEAKSMLIDAASTMFDILKEMIGAFWQGAKMVLSEFWAIFTKKKGYL